MIRYGKTTQTAIAAMSRLAEVHAEGLQLSSHEVARNRGLPQTLVAKLLTTLSQTGLVVGSRGPGGGYALAMPPEEISLLNIVQVFERQEDEIVCPFGPTWCGSEEPCPLHDDYTAFQDQFNGWLSKTTLAVFVKKPKKKRPRKTGRKS